MALQVILTGAARTDLADIWYYFAESVSTTGADSIVDEIVERFGSLATFPEMGRNREEIARGLQSFPVGRYIIFYRVQESSVTIIRVLHSARDIDSLL